MLPTRFVCYPGFQSTISKTIPPFLVCPRIAASVRSSARQVNPQAHAQLKRNLSLSLEQTGARGQAGTRGLCRHSHTHTGCEPQAPRGSCSGLTPRGHHPLLDLPVPLPRSVAPTLQGPPASLHCWFLALGTLPDGQAEQALSQGPHGSQLHAGAPTGRTPACQAQVSGGSSTVSRRS